MEGQATPPSWRFTGSNAVSDQPEASPRSKGGTNRRDRDPEAITWTASEYIAHDKDALWYAMFGAATLVFALLVYVVSRSLLSTIVIVLIGVGVGAYAGRKPNQQTFEVSRDGVVFAGKEFGYEEFRSFSVVQDGAVPSIWLMPLKRIKFPLIMYFEPKDGDRIISILADYLPHEQRTHDPIERLMRYIRF